MKSILVTGGTGFIGSHTCLVLLKKNYQIFIVDSFVNSGQNIINNILKIYHYEEKFKKKINFFKGDIRDKEFLRDVFSIANKRGLFIEMVIHFAGLKSVGESIYDPISYWENNVSGTINLISVMQENSCFSIVFSSSATLYSPLKNISLDENSTINPINPYGRTKFTIENFLKDVFLSQPKKWRIANLRYFNPIGAHSSGLLGESYKGIPTNIFPLIINTGMGSQKEIKIFGNNWPTRDGTPIRDYIHVMDLAEGHIKTVEYLFENKPSLVNFNLGTGKGTSVLELIKVFEKINNVKIPYSFTSRRKGDPCFLVANNKLAKKVLNWFPSRSIQDMCKDGWNSKTLNLN